MKDIYAITAPSHFSKVLSSLHLKNVLLVTGKKSFENSGAEKFISQSTKGIRTTRYFDFSINPNQEDLNIAVQKLSINHFDAILSVGGGSVIDMGKLIKYSVSKSIPLIAVPTTAGTGSEATSFAVLYVNKKKTSVEDKEMLPQIIIHNKTLLESASPYLIAHAALDALSQAIESYWSIHSTEESLAYAKESIRLVWEYLPKVIQTGDKSLMSYLQQAAFVSGKAINITKTTAAHAVSYFFTSHFTIPHGHAVALTLPEFLEMNGNIDEENIADERGVDYVKQRVNEIYGLIGASGSIDAKQKMIRFIEKAGLNISDMQPLGLTETDIPLIIKNINLERSGNNPCKLSIADYTKVLQNVFNRKKRER